MIQRDYLLKLIEEAAYVLSRLLGLRTGGRYEEAFELINQTLGSFFKFKRELLHNTEPEELPQILIRDYGLNDDQLSILADLLREEGELWNAQAEWEKAISSLTRALAILEFLNHKQKDLYSFERVSKMEIIRGKIDELKS
ncbi:MAG: hypothetical protein KDD99_04195 [Bacteroidetes bacterium]|nr:hypothetical protein [Bacteroidota bacterium]